LAAPRRASFPETPARETRAGIDPRWDPIGAAEQKYNPTQPRVPAGNPRGGQWTRRNSGGGGGIPFLGALLGDGEGEGGEFDAGDDSGESDYFGDDGFGAFASEDDGSAVELPEIVLNADTENSRTVSDVIATNIYTPGSQLAQNERTSSYGVDLLEERELGGHAIERHVNKSEEFLLNDVRQQSRSSARRGDFGDGLRSGSFTSLEAANKLVNATITQNSLTVERVASGELPIATLRAVFESPTGYEAYAATERSQAVIRDTYGVAVIIHRDATASRVYRVQTAYPRNFSR
jgi:hypothetical protein